MILPSRRRALLSPLQPAQAVQALRKAVAPRRGWQQKMFQRGSGGFMGEVRDDGFSIVRDIAYRNSFLPFVTGKIESSYPGARVEVTMKMHPAVTGFMAVWIGIALFSFIASAHAYFHASSGHGDPAQIFVPGGMVLFGFGLAWGAFLPEAKKAESFLAATLQATAELPPDPPTAMPPISRARAELTSATTTLCVPVAAAKTASASATALEPVNGSCGLSPTIASSAAKRMRRLG